MQKLLNKVNLDEFTKLVQRVKKHYNISDEEAESHVLSNGPQALKRMNALNPEHGWRAGYTKPSISRRREENRTRNKLARKARRQNKLRNS